MHNPNIVVFWHRKIFTVCSATRIIKKKASIVSASKDGEILAELKSQSGSKMHNKTDVDSCQRAVRAIEIESHNLEHPMENRVFPSIDSVIIGVDINRDARRAKISERLKKRLENGMVAVQPVQNNAKIDIVALSGAYYLLSDMKKGETGEE